jgi:RNA polymerase sigma factor (sigma-70 family)
VDDGRRERFAALFAASYGRVLAYALRRAPRDQAEDVVAETFAIAWRRFDVVPDDPVVWLYATARRVLANTRRAGRRRDQLVARLAAGLPPVPMQEPDPGDRVNEAVLMREALARLGGKDREALMLVGWEGLSNERAASVIGVSSQVFSLRLHRARRRLAEQVARLSETRENRSDGINELEEGSGR